MNTPVHLCLGPTYPPNLWDVRKRLTAARKSGEELLHVSVSAPVTSEIVEMAIEPGSLYLVGIRSGAGAWWEFAPDNEGLPSGEAGSARPRLPNARWITVGALKALSSYRALRLRWYLDATPTGRVYYGETPIALLRFFRSWSGQLNGRHERLPMCVLLFVVCEALRFRSIENICAHWIDPRGKDPALVITQDMLDTVQNWHDRASRGDSDVWTLPPEFPDPLIT